MELAEQDRLVELIASGESLAWRDPRDGSMLAITSIADVEGEKCALLARGLGYAALPPALAEDFFKVAPVFPQEAS